ncbi:hypothetical protein L210DRAFT_3509256 [Boletus edulis BED1]|uniref:Uncharacterized protein n=1 Tax=Boletus edulis BED1 TaxID=1328754 RepID=A0AAD4BF91_BOLED|nr:hypothetical protein L210DRAFT_3509256 [Boletus edulis BED1]
MRVCCGYRRIIIHRSHTRREDKEICTPYGHRLLPMHHSFRQHVTDKQRRFGNDLSGAGHAHEAAHKILEKPVVEARMTQVVVVVVEHTGQGAVKCCLIDGLGPRLHHRTDRRRHGTQPLANYASPSPSKFTTAPTVAGHYHHGHIQASQLAQ